MNLRYYLRRETPSEVRRGSASSKKSCRGGPCLGGPSRIQRKLRSAADAASAKRDLQRRKTQVRFPPLINGDSRAVAVAFSPQRRAAPPLAAGSHEEFIAEHYWGYCTPRDGGTIEYESATRRGTCGRRLPRRSTATPPRSTDRPLRSSALAQPDSAFLAHGSEVSVYKPTRLSHLT